MNLSVVDDSALPLNSYDVEGVNRGCTYDIAIKEGEWTTLMQSIEEISTKWTASWSSR